MARVRRKAEGVESPRLPQRFDGTVFPDDGLVDHELYSGLAVSQHDLSGQSADDVAIEQTHLKRVLLIQTRLALPQMSDVRFETCDLSEAEWEKAHLERVEFVGCRLLGFRLREGRAENLLFRDCMCEWATLVNAVFEATRFENCNLRDASFAGANLSGAVFTRCDLTNVDMQGAKLAGADLRGSNVEGLKVGVKELQGAVIDETQAVSLVRLLGIVVK